VTAREAEVLALIARHLTNAQIAEALFISRRTVETHVSDLRAEMDTRTRSRRGALEAVWDGARAPIGATREAA
jgi:DNA-binding NarL/FixJ family response regulator